jgi:hypothetical protein
LLIGKAGERKAQKDHLSELELLASQVLVAGPNLR